MASVVCPDARRSTALLSTPSSTLEVHLVASLQVFERAKKYRPLGAGVGMDVNGMKAIEAIDPALEKWFYANGWTVPVAKTFDERGEPNFLIMDQMLCNIALDTQSLV